MIINKKYYVVYCNFTNAPFIIEDNKAQVYTNKHAIFIPPEVEDQKNEWKLVEMNGYDSIQRLMSIFGFESFMLDNEEVEVDPLPYDQKVQLNNIAGDFWLKRIKSMQILTDATYDDALDDLKETDFLLAVKEDGTKTLPGEYPPFLMLKNDKFDFVPMFTNMLEFFNFRRGFAGLKVRVVRYKYSRLPEDIRNINLWINPASPNSWLILDKDREILNNN